uniref:Uncharacterized protein n=1 Tax=Meloidogyne javanica TaxID=6303 RepID=A0A915LY64_MELJA
AGDLMTRSLINTPRTLESFDSMYSSMRSPNNCIDAEHLFSVKQQPKNSELSPISAEEMTRYSQSKLITIVSEIEQIIQLYNEELVNELARRDELDYAKEVRNQFITLLIDVQEKRRKAGSIKKQKQKETKFASTKNNLCSVKIPYDNSQEVPDVRVLESLNKILQAMSDDSDQLPSLLTDYILNVICPTKNTNVEEFMDACNTFGPLFKSRLDRVLKQSTNFKAFCFAHHIVKPVLQIPTILIPYDCDRGNFEPCNRNGLGAHWAILTGCLLLCDDSGEESNEENIKIIKSSNEFNNVVNGMKLDEKNLYLIGYQGKSSHPAIWSFQALFESNAQLNVLAECPHYNKNNFCLPPEGIALKGKCLLLLGEGNE